RRASPPPFPYTTLFRSVEHRQPLSAEGGEAGIVIGSSRHGVELDDLAADHGVIAHGKARRRLDTDARQHGVVIAQRRERFEHAADGGALDWLAFGVEYFKDGIERRSEPVRGYFQNQLLAF